MPSKQQPSIFQGGTPKFIKRRQDYTNIQRPKASLSPTSIGNNFNSFNSFKVYGTNENNNNGFKTIIHGDPVFTNILIDNNNTIKFIDMRGKIGSKLSLYGDELYDWAKLYQSLIGYDEILQDKSINEDADIILIF